MSHNNLLSVDIGIVSSCPPLFILLVDTKIRHHKDKMYTYVKLMAYISVYLFMFN